jgi:hypothetical protein
MPVMDPVGASRREFCLALKEPGIHVAPGDGAWEGKIAKGRPVVRVLIKDRWWELRLKPARSWKHRAAYEKIASGAAAAELFIYYVPVDDAQPENAARGDSGGYPRIMCRMVVCPSGEQVEDAEKPHGASLLQTSSLDLGVDPLENLDIGDLREAIRANVVSFPSQVPTFEKHERPDLQRRLAQLYFVLNWDCSNIGARYELAPARVRQILNTWKRRAAETGYIQRIPPAPSGRSSWSDLNTRNSLMLCLSSCNWQYASPSDAAYPV